MGSSENNINAGEEIPQISRAICDLVKYALCPRHVADKETIALTTPWSEDDDYRIGIFLYDIKDYSAISTGYVMQGEESRRYPPKAVELSYMIFCNENKKFGGINREQIQVLLNEIIRTFHDNPVIKTNGEIVQLSFAYLEVDFKLKLWGSFQKALQPAIYINAVPVLIESRHVERVISVRERDYGINRK